MELKMPHGVRCFQRLMLLFTLASCTGIMLISLRITYFNKMTASDVHSTYLPMKCTGKPNANPGSFGVNYTHKMVTVASSRYWYDKYKAERTVRCGDPTRVYVTYSNGDLCKTQNADIVVINGQLDELQWIHLQQLRNSEQVWVHTTEESPFNSKKHVPGRKLHEYIKINITQSYHPDADISVPYGEYVPTNDARGNPTSSFATRVKLIAWVSSHCHTPMWRRADFVYDLSKLVPVDMYGACGSLTCSRGDPACKDIYRQYKFFLSLENSCCKGYITEKFWNTLSVFHSIPVVVGAPKEDYMQSAPPNSFIHADDFDSMEALADYLLLVSRRKDLYDSYFVWRDTGDVVRHPIDDMLAISDNGVCSLLGYLGSELHKKDKKLFDPYGPNWMGGCFMCGQKQWLSEYVESSALKYLT